MTKTNNTNINEATVFEEATLFIMFGIILTAQYVYVSLTEEASMSLLDKVIDAVINYTAAVLDVDNEDDAVTLIPMFPYKTDCLVLYNTVVCHLSDVCKKLMKEMLADDECVKFIRSQVYINPIIKEVADEI